MKCIYTPPSTDTNNCFIDCLTEYLSIISNRKYMLDPIEFRKSYDFIPNMQIKIHEIKRLAIEMNMVIYVWKVLATTHNAIASLIQRNASCDILEIFATMPLDDPDTIKMLNRIDKILSHYQTLNSNALHNKELFHKLKRMDIIIHKGHCYLLKDFQKLSNKARCNVCKEWIIISKFRLHMSKCALCLTCRLPKNPSKDHICQGIRMGPSAFIERNNNMHMESICENWISLKPVPISKKRTSLSKVFFADLEAFPDIANHSNFEPYAAAIYSFGKKGDKKEPVVFFGYNTMISTLNYCNTISNLLYYFNGSGYDNFLHIHAMVKNNFPVDSKSFIRHGGRILTFSQHKNLKIKDLYPFLKTSLAKACEAYNLPPELCKGEFDHDKVHSFEDAEIHRDEIIDYLKHDVLALAELFKIYSKTMFECFSIDITRAITPSAYAYMCWASTCSELSNIYVPHFGKEENDDRAAYYGGRVMCQIKNYVSKDVHEDSNSFAYNRKYNYDDIHDCSYLFDANSLYPTVMLEENYAYGKWFYITKEEIEKNQFAYKFVLSSGEADNNWIQRCMFKVDVICPKDIYTAFLMSRNPITKEIEHNLFDKYEQWYWGVEISHAISLGYEVIKIHEIKEFPLYGPLFQSFITKCYEGRKANPNIGSKTNVKNQCFKDAMNSLSGKFGQHAFDSHWSISSCNSRSVTATKLNKERENFSKNILPNIEDFIPIFDEKGENFALMIKSKAKSKSPNYPVYISAQILAKSRVFMSNLMVVCDSYRNIDRAIYYTDTDSLLMPSECFEILKNLSKIGKELGQLKCDLEGSVNRPSKVVKAIFAATKGPYSIVFIRDGNDHLEEKVRVKGIPHMKDYFRHGENLNLILTSEQKEKFENAKNFIRNPLYYAPPSNLISKRFYFYKVDENNFYFARHIDYFMIEKIMENNGELFCFYGGMKKTFYNNNNEFCNVKPTVVRRQVCATNWWNKNKRWLIANQRMSVPVGFNI